MIRLSTLIPVVIILTAPLVLAQRNQDDQALDTYLESLGLSDLRLLHLEQVLTRDPKNEAAARTLADLYAGRLLVASDPAETASLENRIDALLEQHPSANTPSLRVMRLQGDFNRAEALASSWIDNPSDARDEEKARTLLERITPPLDSLQTTLFSALDAERKAIDEMSESPLRSKREQALEQLAEVAGRALYFDAWSNAYLGMMSEPGQTRSNHLSRARQGFLKLLGVESDTDVSAELLASSGMARAALGLALSDALSDSDPAATHLFDQLRDPQTSPDVRDLADFWQAWTFLQRSQFNRLLDLASRLGPDLANPPSAGRAALCSLLVRSAYGPNAPQSPSLKPQADSALAALVQMRLYDRLKQLLDRYHIDTHARNSIVFRWVEAQSLYDQARASKDSEKFAQSASAFKTALNAPDASEFPALQASSRLLLAWSLYERGDLAPAAESFAQAAAQLKNQKDPAAADALWMHAVALEKLAAKDPARASEAASAFQNFASTYPDHPNTPLVDLEIRKLKGEPMTLEALSRLQPSDPNFAALCLSALQHHETAYLREKAAGRSGGSEAANLRKLLDLFRALPDSAQTPDGTLAAALAEATLAADSDPAQARSILDQAQPASASLSDSDPRVSAYHRARLRLAQQQNDSQSIAAEALWFQQHASDAPNSSDQGLLITLAQAADSALKQADASNRPARLQAARDAYARLVSALGTSPDTLAQNRNALVALARLAAYEQQLGHPEQAAAHYDLILKSHPRDASYLRQAARAHEQARHFDRALSCWDTLVAGLPNASDPWFEAKYHQISTLSKLNPAQARKSFSQFSVLYPKLGTGRWPSLFRQLDQTLPEPSPSR